MSDLSLLPKKRFDIVQRRASCRKIARCLIFINKPGKGL